MQAVHSVRAIGKLTMTCYRHFPSAHEKAKAKCDITSPCAGNDCFCHVEKQRKKKTYGEKYINKNLKGSSFWTKPPTLSPVSWRSPILNLACSSSPRGAPRSASSTYSCRLPSRCTSCHSGCCLSQPTSRALHPRQLFLSPSIALDCFSLLLWSALLLYIHPTCRALTCRLTCIFLDISVYKPEYHSFSHVQTRCAQPASICDVL